MKEPSLRSSRLALAGGLAAAIVLGGGGFLLGRSTTQRTSVTAAPVPTIAVTPVAAPKAPATREVLGRADFIALASAASDITAGGGEAPAAIAAAAGQRFELRLPFGCEGPSPEDSNAPLRWRYNAETKALRLHVEPVAWEAGEWLAEAAPGSGETIEGFWIARPWTASEGCPASGSTGAVGAEAVTLPGQVLALGQTIAADRGRDGNPYDAVVRVAEDALDTSQGFRIKVAGRITADPGPVRCRQPAGAEQRPICLVSVILDEVAIENPATDDVLATWNVAERASPAR